MKRQLMSISAAVVMLSSAGAWASSPAVNPLMLCAVTNTVTCDTAGDCVKGSAQEVNLPVFMQFDADSMTVKSATGMDEKRTSPIATKLSTDTDLQFTGNDGVHSWSAVINKMNGNMTGSVVSDEAGYLFFGSCLKR